MQSVPITTKVVSLNPVHGEVYSIQHYLKFVSDLGRSVVFSGYQVFLFPPPIKLIARYNWNIVESGVKPHNHNPWQLNIISYWPIVFIASDILLRSCFIHVQLLHSDLYIQLISSSYLTSSEICVLENESTCWLGLLEVKEWGNRKHLVLNVNKQSLDHDNVCEIDKIRSQLPKDYTLIQVVSHRCKILFKCLPL
jgi:hypothetical protein